ncbi:MAG: signal peptidase I [Methanomicrobia archaeon]|nr:signal peptidase I [Methanomicrobia archaeon]
MVETTLEKLDLPEPSSLPGLRKKARRRKVIDRILEVLFVVLMLTGTFYLFVHSYYTSVWIDGSSMMPTLLNYEYGLMNTHESRIKRIERYSIIVAVDNLNVTVAKRVIGLPGETIQILDGGTGVDTISITRSGETFILDEGPIPLEKRFGTYNNGSYAHGEPLVLGEDEYFLMGDNRPSSADSRARGPINYEQILGVLFVIEGIADRIYVESQGNESKTIFENRRLYPLWEFRFYY